MAIQERKGKHRITYRVYWRNPITHQIEYKKFDDKPKAERYDAEIKYRLKKDPLSFKPLENNDNITFKELAEKYFIEHPTATSTLKNALITVKKTILPYIGDITACKLEKADLKALEKKWRAKGNKQNTIHRKITYIKAILNWGKEEGYLEENPVLEYRSRIGKDLSIPPLTPEERNLFLKHAPKHLKRAIILGGGLGVRIGQELFNIKWKDFREESKTILVMSAKKGGLDWRELDLTDYLFERLIEWKEEDRQLAEQKENLAYMAYIINYRGKKITSFKRAWKETKEKAGIKRRIRPYDLRHFFATQALANGADLKSVADILGDDPRTVIKTYQHTLSKSKREAMHKVPSPE